MPARPASLIGTVVALAGALGFAWYSFRSGTEAEADLAKANQTLAQTTMDLQRMQDQAATRERETAALREKLQRAPVPVVAAPRPAPNALPDFDKLLEADPKLRALALKDIRAGLEARYRLMYQTLGLTPAQIKQFEDLATAHEDDLITLRAAAKTQGFKWPQLNAPGGAKNASYNTAPEDFSAGLTALIRDSDAQFHAAVSREIGPEVGAALARGDRIRDAQTFVVELDLRRMTGETTLTPTQAVQLTEALLASSSAYQNGGAATLEGVNWDSVRARAADILSPAQLKVFRTRADFYQLGQTIKQSRAQPKTGG